MGADAFDDHVANDETLLRLTWHPIDFDETGGLRPEAFRSEDFKGPGFGVSVDRAELCSKAAVMLRAEKQQPIRPESRKTAILSGSIVGEIRSQVDTKEDLVGDREQEPSPETSMFEIISDPQEGNSAHTLISSSRKRGKGARREARLRLVGFFNRHTQLDDYFANSKHEAR